ncbi:MAG: hypothetical protein QGG64_22660 [Candidatus Latescibacteria bacterium]|nr:hypothetical protein [Candidatus Latescibacterota bacterium]
MVQIDRVQCPSREQYREAHRLSASYWTHFGVLDCDPRFALFERLGVELVLARDDRELLGVCFILPDSVATPNGRRQLFWLFNLYARPEAHNLGALMLMRIMRWYSPIMCIGVTEQAGQIYRALRWQCYEDVWRCVHPIDLQGTVAQFGQDLSSRWQLFALRITGFLYNPLMRLVERLLSVGVLLHDVEGIAADVAPEQLPPEPEKRVALVATYLNAYATSGLHAVEIGGIGRLVRDDLTGLQRMREHARMRRELREQGAVVNEFVAVSQREKKRALWCGAVPIRMPIYYWDKDGVLGTFFNTFEQSEFTFASCEKIF